MRDSQIETYSNKHVEMIDSLNDSRLNYYIIGIIEEIANNETIKLDEDNILDVSDDYLKLEALEAIFDNIEREEDKILFATAISENASLLGVRIADEFTKKLNSLKSNTENSEETDNSDDSAEEQEEEQELDEPAPTFDSDSEPEPDAPEDEEEKENEEEKAPEQPLEGPAITEYKAKTAEMEKELEELIAKLNSEAPINNDNPEKEEPDYLNAIEILKNSIKENNEIRTKLNGEPYNLGLEIIEPSNDLVAAMESATKVSILEKEIQDKEKEIESLNNDIESLTANIERMKQEGKPVNVMTYTLNGRVKERDELVKEVADLKYRKQIAEESAVYLDATKIRSIIVEEIAYSNETISAIANYRNEIESQKEHVPFELQLNGEGTYQDRLNNIMNNLFTAQRTFENQSKEINVKPKTSDIDIDKKELTELAEKLKEEIEKRKENIAKYYDALNDIKNLGNEVKAGKNPEELQDKIDAINNKIDTITDDKLKEELRGELNKALNPEIEKEKEEPEKTGHVKKDPNKWKKWVSGIAGLALGAGIIGLTPLGLPGALAIAAGTQLAKKGVNKVHEKLKNENEVTNIEKTGKLAQFKEKIKGWLKDENIVKNINWFLNGATIGALSMGAIEYISSLGGTPVPPEPTDPYSNIKIGDNASGLDLTKGYDQANWASQNINAESLNQAIMQDGNSIIDSVRVTKDGVTHIVDSAGKSLKEVAQQLGVSPEELVMNITNKQGAARAWVDAAEAVGRTL